MERVDSFFNAMEPLVCDKYIPRMQRTGPTKLIEVIEICSELLCE